MMHGPGDVLYALAPFKLDLLEAEWVTDIWKNDFDTCPDDLPIEYGDTFSLCGNQEIVDVMTGAKMAISGWLNKPSSSSDSEAAANWTALQELDFKGLLALLYFNMKKGLSNNQNVDSVELAVKSGEFYLSLLSIPGSSVYSIFQGGLYGTFLELFSLVKYLQKTKAPTGGRRNQSVDEYEITALQLNVKQQQAIVKMLNKLLLSFKSFVKIFSFRSLRDCLKLTLDVMADLTRTERESVAYFSENNNKYLFSMLARNAYLVMAEMCDELHGRVPEIIRKVLYRVLPNLSLNSTSVPEMRTWSNKEQAVVRGCALWFLKNCILPLGSPAHSAIRTILQHLCRSMIDKVEYRDKATDMIISIMSMLPQELYYGMLKFIFREAYQDAANLRVIAVELLSKLIYLKQGSPERSNMAEESEMNMDLEPSCSQVGSDPSDNTSPIEKTNQSESSVSQARVLSFCKPIEYVSTAYRRSMLSIIVDRINDESVTVRVRALNALAEIISNQSSPTVRSIINSIFVTPYEGSDGIDLNGDEKDFTDHPLDKLNDPKLLEKMLPGGRNIVKLVLKKGVNNSVNVRKAVISVLVQLFKLNSQWMSETILAQFVMHCRDKAISVRKEMADCLTDLLMFSPTNELIKCWVAEVMPLIKDNDSSVQSHILQILTKTILTNIKPLERTMTEKDVLPWSIMLQIAAQKLRQFLILTCGLWREKKTPELNTKKISDIRSHISSDNNTAAWVLLSSISEHYVLDDPVEISSYYLHDAVRYKEVDPGLGTMVVKTIINSWHHLSKERQLMLRDQLVSDVKRDLVSPYLLPLIVEVISGIIVTIDDDEEQGRKNLAKWIYEENQVCEDHLLDCLKNFTAGINEVCDLCVIKMVLLGCLAELRPQTSSRTFEAILDFLTYPDWSRRKLKNVSVLTLTRMSLRDGNYANRLLSSFNSLLMTHSEPSFVNNVIIAVADLGERFPNMIEEIVPAMSLCLKHRQKEVRDVTLFHLLELLGSKYLRARGALNYHILSLLPKACPTTASAVKGYFKIFQKHQKEIPEVIIHGIFHYNKYYNYIYKKLTISYNEEIQFDMSGENNHRARLIVYKALLNYLDAPYKSYCYERIAETILHGVAGKIIKLSDPNGVQVLRDALVIGASHELLFNPNEKSACDGDEPEDSSPENIKMAYIKALQSHILSEKIIPTCIKLKKVLSDKPDLRGLRELLYRFLREVLRDHKDEILEWFKEDRQFGQEILHEINTIPRDKKELEELPEPEPNPEAIRSVVPDLQRISKRKSNEMNSEKSPESSDRSKRLKPITGSGSSHESLPLAGSVVEAHTSQESHNEPVSQIGDQAVELSNAVSKLKVTGSKPRGKNKRVSSTASSTSGDPSPKRSSRRAKSQSSDSSKDMVEVMKPPAVKRTSRMPKKSPNTPAATSGKNKLLSSTPFLATNQSFAGSEISPVVEQEK